MKRNRWSLRRVLWTVACLIVLLATQYFFDGRPNSDADQLLVYGMGMLSFPMSVVTVTLLSALARVPYEIAGFAMPTSRMSILIGWIILFSVGYWQWFVLAPAIMRRWRRR